MGYDSCATCCAIFSLLGIVHLVLFGRMFSEKAISFALMAVEHGWDGETKAKACYNGAIIYTVTLFLSVLARVYFRRNDAAKAALLHAQHIEEIQGLLVPPTMSTGSSQH
ncbi:conserved hypothetical protein [Leishmania major strain Friedlin]|uniref:Transmembrane protein n=1 Tax=Leishmania major TaxID=5664 RepID=Q4QDS6_LEIMA|nr:conserved hypothetical protein [Leishmania major strain Friedlin]CAG9572502.1 hypothetical_protein_-_conserved [Leishmania major strain Friedlin]CAJ04026.1 conserved hypothetical protein [Leishmania major strain Friedlin]|eukprot:XP_001682522.1 conserved hypothetical protein [Leishmania major strain Friedlin]